MKKLIALPLTAAFCGFGGLCCLIGLGGCGKSTNLGNAAGGTGGQDSGSFIATIDGKSWTAIDSARSVAIMNGTISISGISSDDQNIVLSLAGTGVGTYTLGQASKSVAAYTNSFMYLQDFSTIFGNSSQSGGQVVVSQIDATNHTISGTFTMQLFSDSARTTMHFTNGVFTKLPYITSLPPAPATDTFTVEINGVPWTAPAITANIVEGEFMVRGSTQDGREWVNIGVPIPSWMGPGASTLAVGLNQTGTYMGEYSNNDSVYLSAHYAPASPPGAGDYYFWYNSGSLEILQNDLSAHRLSADFQLTVTDSTGVVAVQLANGHFSIIY